MDTTAHRIIKQARDTLIDGLHDRPGHGLTIDQEDSLNHIIWALWDLMGKDPAPPECQACCTPLYVPREGRAILGRPRRFCSDACRQQDSRRQRRSPDVGRLSATWPPLHGPSDTETEDGGF
jgi:hypothetical protein